MLRNVNAISGGRLLKLTCLLTVFVLTVSIQGLFPLPVHADDKPDLIIQSMTLSPDEPELAETVTITVNVKNQGAGYASASHVVCYIDATIIGTNNIGSLAPGMMTTTSFQWTAENGPHTIKCVADSSEAVSETDETNNTETYSLTPLAADLIIESISWSPMSPSQGDQVEFRIAVTNIGSVRSKASSVTLYIDGNSRGLHDIPVVDPGATISDTYTWMTQTGQHTIKATVDSRNHVTESDELNNQKTITFSPEAPDVMIADVTTEPENPSKDDDVLFTVTVTNAGSGRAGECHLGYTIDDDTQTPLNVPELESGNSVNVTFTWTALSDTHTFIFAIDYYERISESDENNNTYTYDVTMLPPDLTIDDITWTPSDAAVGDTVTFTVTVSNIGAGKAGPTRLAPYITGEFQGYVSVPTLDADESISVTFTWEAKTGTHNVSVSADYDMAEAETNESNNKIIKAISVIPPDLIISDITWEPENPNFNDTVVFTVNLTNQGGGKAENFVVGYYLDDEYITSASITALGANSSVNKTYSWKAQEGRHTFKAVVDYNKHVVEDNENNNTFAVTVVPNMPDLVIQAVTWDEEDVIPGTEVVFDIGIKNTGTMVAVPSRVSYYLDGVATGYTDIGTVKPGETITAKFVWTTSKEHHHIEIIADATNLVQEIDEANNSRIVTLPPPDITVDTISWTPEDASVGDTITFTVTLRNSGESTTQPSRVACSIDGESPVTIDFPAIPAGTTVSETFEWTAMKGSHSLAVMADVTNTTTETNETNNTRTVSFATLTPDLGFGDITWKMQNPLVQNEVEFSVVISNSGSDITGYSSLTYSFDGGALVRSELPAIPAGETEVVTFKAILESGSHDLVLTLDIDETVTELDEQNNVMTYSFTTSAPDLIVRSITWLPEVAAAGDNVTITAAIENRGKHIAEDVVATITLDGITLGEISFERIGVGEKLTGDIIWTVEPGMHEIGVCADYGETVIESDETNNTFSRTISLGGPPVTGETDETRLPVTNDVPDKGMLADSWMLIIVVAIILGGSSFYLLFRSFKKD